MERLQKVIASSGFCSRRKAEEYIALGRVLVNGKVVSEMGFKVSPSDVININGKDLKREVKEYVLLYKPRGVVTTTSDDKGRKTVMDLIDTPNRLYPVGRLDYDTSGILLLTNDGELTNLLLHPKHEVDKVYLAKVNGIFTSENARKMASGVYIDGKKTAKALVKVKKIDFKSKTSLVTLVIHEGRNHQVKNMFSALGFEVLKLKREKFAFLDLTGLKSGEYRHLSIKEVKTLYSLGK